MFKKQKPKTNSNLRNRFADFFEDLVRNEGKSNFNAFKKTNSEAN
jgi:hypothetical protein